MAAPLPPPAIPPMMAPSPAPPPIAHRLRLPLLFSARAYGGRLQRISLAVDGDGIEREAQLRAALEFTQRRGFDHGSRERGAGVEQSFDLLRPAAQLRSR